MEPDEGSGIDLEEYGLFGSFADFTSLKFIHINIALLVGYNVGYNGNGSLERKLTEVLPSSLETCSFEVWHEHFGFELLDGLAELTGSERFPNLIKIHLRAEDWIKEQLNDANLEWLQQKCQEAGVSFNVTKFWRHEDADRFCMDDMRPAIWPYNEAEALSR